MIAPPYVFCKIQWKLLHGYSTFRSAFSFEKSQESLETIDMISFSITVLIFTMIDEMMNISLSNQFRCGHSKY